MSVIKRVIAGFRIQDTKKIFPSQCEFVVSYHDPRSITWSWCFRWTPPWRLRNKKSHSLRRMITGYYSFHRQDKMFKN